MRIVDTHTQQLHARARLLLHVSPHAHCSIAAAEPPALSLSYVRAALSGEDDPAAYTYFYMNASSSKSSSSSNS